MTISSHAMEVIRSTQQYCNSLHQYQRRKTRVVEIGELPLGGDHPIRVQSMTTVDTMDTKGSVDQCIRMIKAGCEYIRITAPTVKEAKNLKNIKEGLRSRGYINPIIADIHFTPNAAELAAQVVEKVRINPGNYADKKRFKEIDYTDASYQLEIERIRERFIPLIKICKEHGTAMRIGTNHGSLSDRIMSRYGDTPIGMVESALEFLRICEEFNYHEVVLSMKSSNPLVMVQAYRLLVSKMDEEGLQPYPLHLGVTEAGEAEDGRIKSSIGIGTLLEDGLGDTVRVSLTEEPEVEGPVARMLVDRLYKREGHEPISGVEEPDFDPYAYKRRKCNAIDNIGGGQVPRVFADLQDYQSIGLPQLKAVGHHYLPELDKWAMSDIAVDYLYTKNTVVDDLPPNGLKQVIDYGLWQKLGREDLYPLLHHNQLGDQRHPVLNFVLISTNELAWLEHKDLTACVLVLETSNLHAMADLRNAFFKLDRLGIRSPVIVRRGYVTPPTEDQLLINGSTEVGGLLIDGLGDGIWLSVPHPKLQASETLNNLSFGILQAARTRITKTEYISCPSCGRTLFDLQETTAMIRKVTDHLKGVKIGIMGCIVNGPGEMADADYGYVGSGKGKITLYKGKEVVKRSVPSENALDELIELIKDDGAWIEPPGKL